MCKELPLCAQQHLLALYFPPLPLALKRVVMAVARHTLLNLFIQAVVIFLERRDKDSRASNVGANLCRLFKASSFFPLLTVSIH